MAATMLFDRLEDLRIRIEQTHLGYIEYGDQRDMLREKLETYMREYLSIAPHDRKFTYPQTAQVLRRSAANSDNFSGRRAASAWAALADYADNLITQPWRKEFRQIQLYCGFYKHKIESSLVGAELMFEAMGYKHSGDCTLNLHGVLDPDRIINVSKDAILALVECNIMQEIWDAMARQVTWAQVLEFRENYPGTADQAIRALKYRVRERQYKEDLSRRPRGCSFSSYYDGHPMYHTSHACSAPRYAHIVSPQQIVPPPAMYQNPLPYSHQSILKPQELYPSNGYHMHYPTPPHPQNGYTHAHYPQTHPHVSSVPTGQLIEFEQSPGHIPHFPHTSYPYPVPEPVRTAEFPSSKAKDDGAGAWENWDYVYRNLENRKENIEKEYVGAGDSDLNDRFRSMNVTSKTRTTVQSKKSDRTRTDGDGEARHRLTKNSNDVEDSVQKSRLSKISVDNSTDSGRSKSNRPLVDYDTPDSSSSRVNHVTVDVPTKSKSNRLEVDIEPESSKQSPSPDRSRRTPEPPHVVTLDVSPSFLSQQTVSPVVDLPPEGDNWQCVYCTFSNNPVRNACEMCGKSRNRGSEAKPQPSGGQQCKSCTLVNERGRNFCVACDTSLKDSATYI